MSSKMLHTCLRVENLEKSIAFYQDAFGFEEKRRKDFPDYKFTIVYLALPGDDYELELTYIMIMVHMSSEMAMLTLL